MDRDRRSNGNADVLTFKWDFDTIRGPGAVALQQQQLAAAAALGGAGGGGGRGSPGGSPQKNQSPARGHGDRTGSPA